MSISSGVNDRKLQLIGFWALLLTVLVVVFLMWLPFLKLLALGGILAVLFSPLYRSTVKETGHEALSALFTIFVILLIVLIPVYIFGQLLFNELYALYFQFTQNGFNLAQSPLIHNLPVQVQGIAYQVFSDTGAKLTAAASDLFASFSNVLSNAANFFISFIAVFLATYYFLRDGDKIKHYFAGIFPLSSEHENLLITKLESAVEGIVKGQFLVALLQGSVATVGFLIFGVPQPFLWGAFTMLTAFIPSIGTSISLIPAILFLMFTGHTWAGIGLLIWYVILHMGIDNLLAPRIIGSRTQMHPLLVLFGVLGGLQFFGYMGFFLGPILVAVLITLLDIYRTQLKDHSLS